MASTDYMTKKNFLLILQKLYGSQNKLLSTHTYSALYSWFNDGDKVIRLMTHYKIKSFRELGRIPVTEWLKISKMGKERVLEFIHALETSGVPFENLQREDIIVVNNNISSELITAQKIRNDLRNVLNNLNRVLSKYGC